eukprot:243006_1
MLYLLHIVLIIDTLRGQTGTCCYNPECAMPNAAASNTLTLTHSTIKDSTTKLNAASCCPSGGDALIKYNGETSADLLCRCSNGGFIQQSCPYSNSEALVCSNVPSNDDACPDTKLGEQEINGVKACIHWTADGIHYVPQRCPGFVSTPNSLSVHFPYMRFCDLYPVVVYPQPHNISSWGRETTQETCVELVLILFLSHHPIIFIFKSHS